MYCIKCGGEIPEGSDFCPNCNTPMVKKEEPVSVEPDNLIQNESYKPYDTSTKGMAATGFFLPPVGIIFFFLAKKDTPIRAKTALEGAIFGIVTYALAAVIFIYLVLPVEKKYAIKYQCEKNTPGAVYNYATYTCNHPDGTEIKIIPK